LRYRMYMLPFDNENRTYLSGGGYCIEMG
jgi:hypothetical protein